MSGGNGTIELPAIAPSDYADRALHDFLTELNRRKSFRQAVK